MVELSPDLGGHLAGPAASVDPDAARQAAQDILDGSKFQEPQFPRPFQGVLEWVADRLRPLFDWIGDVLEPVIDLFLGLPGGRYVLVALIGALIGVLVHWLLGRRSRSEVTRSVGSGLVDLRSDPEALDEEARQAEAAGDHRTAVRRRYESGLIRLVRADRLLLRPETTAGSAARQVDEPAMDALTADFEQIVYGGRAATAADSDRARRLWPELVGERAPR
ncbi:MAG: DUF4129 domain-containing protein [Acidimicrobiales bacterium]|nr:DUF4129 domain-containing protein [Acidimicrobiales bacterium]